MFQFLLIHKQRIHHVYTFTLYFLSFQHVGNAESYPFTQDSAKGVGIKQKIAGMPCTYCLGCKQTSDINITRCNKFDPSGNGEKIWNDLKENGKLTEKSTDENLKCNLILDLKTNFFRLISSYPLNLFSSSCSQGCGSGPISPDHR